MWAIHVNARFKAVANMFWVVARSFLCMLKRCTECTLMLSFRGFITSKNAKRLRRKERFSLSGFREVNERLWQTQLETHETVERFRFPVEHYSDGRLKHKYMRPPESRPDTTERLRVQLPTLARQIISRSFKNKPQTSPTLKIIYYYLLWPSLWNLG